MPRLTMLALWLIAGILSGSLFAADAPSTIQSINKMSLSFTKNMGQWDDRVLFRATTGGATMWFTREGVTYQFTRRIDTRSGAVSAPSVGQNRFGFDAAGLGSIDRFSDEPDSIEQLILTAKFLGANPNPEVITEGQLEYKCNYFLGNDPTKWHTDVPNYEAITLKDIYPGIDLQYSGDGNGQAAYEFIAAPGADIAQIKVEYEGAEETSLDDEGRMILKTKWGDMVATSGSGVNGTGLASPRFAQSSENAFGLAAANQSLAQANSGTLTLAYSTYLGGGERDHGYDIAVNNGGNAFVTGYTSSLDFPTMNPYQTNQAGDDVVVTKISSAGNSLIYSTYLGGSDLDWGYSIALDDSDNAYVTGFTGSFDFPTLHPFQTHQCKYDCRDAFVTKLNSAGNILLYSTYLGGEGLDEAYDIAADGSGNAYVTGNTLSSDFPTKNANQSTYQGGGPFGGDAFVTKLSTTGTDLVYSTYLGGQAADEGLSIAVNDSGCAYVTGYTVSANFPTLGAYQWDKGERDAFVTKLSSAGSSLVYSTYLGGECLDQGEGIALDDSGNAFVTGFTCSLQFPILNAPQGQFQGVYDAFVTKLNNSGNALSYSTFLGGGDWDRGLAVAVDRGGSVYITGYTLSSDFPTQFPIQGDQGSYDVFVAKLCSSGTALIYSTYLGGGGDDIPNGIAVDGTADTYIAGYTPSSDFPVQNPYQITMGPWDAMFVTKLAWTPDYICGDVNTDEQVNLLDAVFLINYIFVGGPAPQLLSLGDVDCSGGINIADVVLMINYIFRGGPAPCAECE